MNHLDVKPGNVLLRKNGDVVLIDFGMSKNYDKMGEATTSSPIGVSIGYAPIEQSRVGGLGMFSPATDIYSLGATMFKMITGQTPPEATAVFDEGLPDMPSTISENTKLVIEKAMQPRRKDRYQTIEDFMLALDVNNVVVSQMEVVEDVNKPEEMLEENIEPKETPKFLKEDDKEATMFITDYMVQASDIATSEVVDLGLSVKWCGHNLGASTPEEYGNYYRWAYGSDGHSTNGIPADSEIAGTEYDAAYKESNGKYKTPTRNQFKELIDRCRWCWVAYKGVMGCKITGPSGKSIFLPGAGRKSDYGIYRKDTFGYYWSSSKANNSNAYYLYFNEEDSDLEYEPVLTMRTIRPVCE